MKRKICVVITARPSYSRVKTALHAIQDHKDLELQLVLAGSAISERFGNIASVIKQDGFEVSEKVHMLLDGSNLISMAKTTGLGIIELSTIFDRLSPDIVITVADRYETISTAIAASYLNIPVAHIQGGEVTGSIDEKVRHAVTKLSNIHLVSTAQAKKRVEALGEPAETVFNTGCPSVDLAKTVLSSPELSDSPFKKYGGVGADLDIDKDFLIVMQHPVTNESNNAENQLEETLYAIKEINIPTIFLWPNPDAGSDGASKSIRRFREIEKPKYIHFFKNIAPHDFQRLLLKCKCLIGNSSVGVRECSYLGVPVVNIGTRQSGRERGKNVIDTDYSRELIVAAIKEQISKENIPRDKTYGDGDAGVKIADILCKVSLNTNKRLPF